MQYSLRPATIADLEPMMAIGHEGIRPYVEAVRGWNEAEEERGFVEHFVPEEISIILVDGQEAGYIKIERHAEYDYLDGIYLARACRSKGLGALVIADTIAASHARGKAIRLRVLKSNPARRLYERLGFRQIGADPIHLLMEA